MILGFCANLPVVIVAAVDARLAAEARRVRVQRPATLGARQTALVPGALHGHQVETVLDLQAAAGANVAARTALTVALAVALAVAVLHRHVVGTLSLLSFC